MSFKKYLKETEEYSAEEFEAGENALNHLKEALKELQIADQKKSGHYEDWKYYISKVQELISHDNGEAGLESWLYKMLPKPVMTKLGGPVYATRPEKEY